MRLTRAWIAIALLFAATPVWAAGNPEAGKAKAGTCQGCHGSNGISAIPNIPSLAGQTDQFLQWQLVFFRSGRRDNPIMGPISQTLSDEDVRDLGAYFASLTPPAPPAASDGNPTLSAAGKDAAAQHHCSACHTEAFTGKQAAARLADQHEVYLTKALADYRSGSRPSTGVAAMTEAASGLSDDDIAALSHYIATLN